MDLDRFVGSDCTPGAVVMQCFRNDLYVALGMGVGQHDIFFKDQLFLFTDDQAAPGLAAPVSPAGLNVEAGFAQATDALFGFVFQPRTRDQQFELVMFIAKGGGEIGQRVVESGIGLGYVRGDHAVDRQPCAQRDCEQQGKACSDNDARIHR